ncbi:MAG: 3-hydroxyacyl-ACP dehydratase FabZ family protein [Planctomycetia bacterium]|nr:3-hydroxyacyl-ACP dehydratase FabZ family protein [Planctomycetia bacterium]
MDISPEVLSSLPHRPPFLFVDTINDVNDQRIVCQKTFTGEEAFFQGHYPEYPLVPGVLLCEATMQAGAILLKKRLENAAEKKFDGALPVVAKMTDIRFRQSVRPGDTILMEVALVESAANAFTFSASVSVNGKNAVRLKYVVMLVKRNDA